MAAPPDPLVVSNTTPLSNLIRLRRLPLLGRLYGSVLVPQQVADELSRGRHVLGDWESAPGREHLVVVAPLDGPLLKQFRQALDEGESSAIALAIERNADLLLIDELAGRQVARVHGVPIAGTLGILLDAKKEGYIDRVRPLLDELTAAGFFIDAKLREKVLLLASEPADG